MSLMSSLFSLIFEPFVLYKREVLKTSRPRKSHWIPCHLCLSELVLLPSGIWVVIIIRASLWIVPFSHPSLLHVLLLCVWSLLGPVKAPLSWSLFQYIARLCVRVYFYCRWVCCVKNTSGTSLLKQIGNHFLLGSELNPFICTDKPDTCGFNPVIIFLTALLRYNLRIIKFTYCKCKTQQFFW